MTKRAPQETVADCQQENKRTDFNEWLIGTGEMAEAIRLFDWSRTCLGPREKWPAVLCFSVNSMLASPLATAIIWGDESLLLYNDGFRAIAGNKHPSALGRSTKDIWPEVWDLAKPAFEGVTACKESVFLGDHFEEAWFTLSYFPIFSAQGGVVGTQIVLVETTQRKRTEEALKASEARLKEAQRLARVGNWELDLRTQKLLWSDEIYRLFELKPGDFGASYEAFLAAIHPDDRDVVNQAYTDSLNARLPYEIEHRLLMKDGRIKVVLEKCENFYDEKGAAIRSIGTVQDITERKALEDELRAAIELRDEFMSVASHELKTPLTALQLQLQLLKRLTSVESALMDSRIPVLSQSAFDSVQSLSILLNDLLDVTRIRVGKLKLERREMDFRIAAIECVTRVQEEARQKGSSITLRADQPVLGRWDPTRISQILSNLLSNAIKYGEGQPIVVSVAADPDRGLARLLIQDLGMGISQELQTKIFERFHRGVSGDRISGLGLGLYIVRQIIEAHGGAIRVQSQPGKGALFIVELPLVPPLSEDQDE